MNDIGATPRTPALFARPKSCQKRAPEKISGTLRSFRPSVKQFKLDAPAPQTRIAS